MKGEGLRVEADCRAEHIEKSLEEAVGEGEVARTEVVVAVEGLEWSSTRWDAQAGR